MPFFCIRLLRCRVCLLFMLVLAGSGCVRRHFFQADARIGPGSTEPLPASADSVLGTAGRHYTGHSSLYHALMGRHYRQVWAAPVQVPVLRLPTAVPGGLHPGKTGGGFQSISITLEGANNSEYALRALDKEPSKTLPKVLRHTFVMNMVRDATSAAIPYGALTVPPLAQAAGVPHAHPRLLYVRPDETGLNSALERFRGKMALLEEKYTTLAARTPELAAATEFVGGEAMLKKVYTHPSYSIDQLAFLRARLLDVWIGDWDRHEGQWQWAAFAEVGGRVRFQGIPKDRDQVYFRFDDGLVPWLAARRFIAPKFHTFKAEYGYMPGLVKQARFIDERGLSQMTKADFQRTALDLQRRLPDSLIDRAMRRLPPSVYALEGPHLAAALKARRKTLPQAAQAYYLTLARKPTLGGTVLPERFVVHRYPDSTIVRVFSPPLRRLSNSDSLRFQRTYFSPETRELSLDGLGGNDVFEVTTTGTGKPMKLLLYGGHGHNQLRLQGSSRRLRLFDEASDMTASGTHRASLPKKKRRAYNRLNDD
ncbi:MAG: hypothetical protein JWR44_667 [Hymenobacter sp.]|nr:hypothetical protein [Hymenobacter sp.]